MNKTLVRFAVWILLPAVLAALPLVGMAHGETAYDWYFKPNDTHTRPVAVPEAEFVSDYSAVKWLGADKKQLYLTFDAGYDNGNLPKILDVLKQKGVKGAFFVDGNFVKSNPALVKRICAEGHILGNHSLSHADMSKLGDFEKYKQQIEGWNELVTEVGGTPSRYFRFPCGRFSETALRYNDKLGLTSVFWSFAYYDWDTENQPDTAAALQKVLSRTHNGCVLLLHSCSAANVAILPDYIDRMRTEGYEFLPISAL